VVSGLLTLLAQAQFLDPSRGPSQSGDFRVSPTAFIAIIGAGFLVAIAGHVLRSRPLVAFGIALIFGATVVVPVVLTLAN
jgi:Flp pilus assembly protein TadB